MVSAWWLLVAACVGVSIGMFLFAVMTMAGTEPQHEAVSPAASDALT